MKRGVVVLVVGLAITCHARSARADARTLALVDGHTGAVLRLRPFTRLGRPSARSWARLDHFLGSRRSGSVHRIHPRLLRSLAQLQRHFGGAPIQVMSAYRAPADLGGPHGYHGLGRAADLRVEGVSPREVFEYCRRLSEMGCGLYPNTGFAHVDARPRGAVWVDLSSGEGSAYVDGVDAWLARHDDAGRRRPRRPYRQDPGAALDDREVLVAPRRRGAR